MDTRSATGRAPPGAEGTDDFFMFRYKVISRAAFDHVGNLWVFVLAFHAGRCSVVDGLCLAQILTCPRRHSHDWTSCPYAHSGESARRRDPSVYRPIPCPESKSVSMTIDQDPWEGGAQE